MKITDQGYVKVRKLNKGSIYFSLP